MKKYIIFDFDGTIADTLHTVVGVFNQLSQSFGAKPIDPDDVETFRNKTSEEILKFLKISIFKMPFLVRRGKHELGKKIADLKPISGIAEVLADLKADGYTLGIVTSNSVKNVEIFLKGNNLDHFDFVYSAGMFRKRGILRSLHKRLTTQHEATSPIIYIGDETRDVDAAKAAGMYVISVTWGLNARPLLEKHAPNAIAETPSELKKLIKQLNKESHGK